MKTFIGLKEIKAGPVMTREEYCTYRGWKVPEDENPNDLVYLVEYPIKGDEKPNHKDHEGYISMSPKQVFDEAYRVELKAVPQPEARFLPHQHRVCEEARELKKKIRDLGDFTGTHIFNLLVEAEQDRLRQQLLAMKYYLTILIERIQNF